MRVPAWAALAVLCLSGAASAQTPSGRSGMSSSERAANINAYRELQVLGACFARTQRREALAIMAATQGSREESELLRRSFYGERETCMGGGDQMQMPSVFARGAIAEGLLMSGGVPPEQRLPAPAQVRDLGGAGRCFAAGHAAEIRALLQTRIGSAEETAAVTALWPAFRTCIPRFQIRLNAVWIRYILAEGLLTLAPASPAPAGN